MQLSSASLDTLSSSIALQDIVLYHALIIVNEPSYSSFTHLLHFILFPPSSIDFFGLDVAIGIASGWSFIIYICINEVPLVLKNIFRLLH